MRPASGRAGLIRKDIVIVYGILLLASRLWVAYAGGEGDRAVPPSKRVVQVKLAPDSAPVRIAYRDSAPERGDLPVVLLLHGSPGASDVFAALEPCLADRHRVIAPDLPGFGHSTRTVPDYSFHAHARYVLAFAARLGIAQADWIGFSMGGGVILSAQSLDPGRVRSLVLLSAIGVQEEELTGNYHWNHAIHGAQVAAFWLGRELMPHFGLLAGSELTLEYARNFYDSDQRPLRGILGRYRGPLLILHGKRDPLVNPRAAVEHHRLAPQSRLLMLDEDHFMTFLKPAAFCAQLNSFLAEPRP